MLEPRDRTIIKVDLRAPLRSKAGLYVLRFELRYSFKLHTIGLPISFRVQLDTDGSVGSFSNGSSLKGSASNSANSSSIVMSELSHDSLHIVPISQERYHLQRLISSFGAFLNYFVYTLHSNG